MPDIRRVGTGTLVGRNAPYWEVKAEKARLSIYEDSMKIEMPKLGQSVVLTHEYGRGGLIVTCCRASHDPEIAPPNAV